MTYNYSQLTEEETFRLSPISPVSPLSPTTSSIPSSPTEHQLYLEDQKQLQEQIQRLEQEIQELKQTLLSPKQDIMKEEHSSLNQKQDCDCYECILCCSFCLLTNNR